MKLPAESQPRARSCSPLKATILVMATLSTIAAVLTRSVLSAQTNPPARACQFDTAAHTDVLPLELSIRAFRGDDTIPNAALTQGLGFLLRGHFALPPTFNGLLYPNNYWPGQGKVTRYFGTIQFELTPLGATNDVKWFAGSLDPKTDDAFEASLTEAFKSPDFKDLAGSTGWDKPERVRVQMLLTQDTMFRAPLLRLNVPMVRVDTSIGKGAGLGLLLPRDVLETMSNGPRTIFEFTVNVDGKADKHSTQVVEAPSLSVAATTLQVILAEKYTPAHVGKCDVPIRVPFVTGH